MQPNEQLPSSGSQQSNTPTQPTTEPVVQPQTTAQTPVTTPTTVPAASPAQPKASVGKKIGMVPAIIIALVLIFGASAAAYVGFVVPNKPENVWKTAMANTSKGIDKLVDYTKEQKQLKGAKISGSFKFESTGGVSADGTYQGSYYDKDSNTTADISAAGSKVKLDLLTHVPENVTNPDIYIRVNGLGGLSSVLKGVDPATAKYLSTIDNQWYFLDHTAFDKLESTVSKAETTPQLSPDDVIAIEQAVVNVNKQYLFTTDESKSVLKVSNFVGKEKVDDRTMYHYQVTVNKENAKSYINALSEELKKTKLGEIYKDQDFNKAMGFDEAIKTIDSMKDGRGANVWIDAKTKLVRKVRLTSEDGKTHMDLALNYNGSGSIYPLVIGIYSDDEKDKGSVVMNLDLDTSKNTVAFTLNGDIAEVGKGNLKLTIEKSDQPVQFVQPANAKSVYELLGPMLSGFGGDIPTSELPNASILAQ